MNRRRILGIDPSLTGTGLAVITSRTAWVGTVDPSKRTGHERLAYILGEVIGSADDETLAVIEGPAFSSKTGHAHERAGLWWLITHRLWRKQIPVAVVTPTTLKRYALGRGVGDKDQVLAAVIRRYDSLVQVADNNQADALVLAAMAADHLGMAPIGAPATHRAALSAVDWPDTEQE